MRARVSVNILGPEGGRFWAPVKKGKKVGKSEMHGKGQETQEKWKYKEEKKKKKKKKKEGSGLWEMGRMFGDSWWGKEK